MSCAVGDFAKPLDTYFLFRDMWFIEGSCIHVCCTCIQQAVHYMYTICTHIHGSHNIPQNIHLLQFCILAYQLIKYHCRELSKNSLTHHSPGRTSGGGGGGLRGPTRGGYGKGLRGLIEVFPPDWRGRAIDLILKETKEPEKTSTW